MSQLEILEFPDPRLRTVAKPVSDPMRLGQRPRVRTTEDYILAAAKGETPNDDD